MKNFCHFSLPSLKIFFNNFYLSYHQHKQIALRTSFPSTKSLSEKLAWKTLTKEIAAENKKSLNSSINIAKEKFNISYNPVLESIPGKFVIFFPENRHEKLKTSAPRSYDFRIRF